MYRSLMRTIASIAAACILSISMVAAVPAPATAAPLPTVEVNGRPLRDSLARLENGRFLIGLRAAAEALGATVDWDEAAQRITMTRGQNQATLWINTKTAWVNGERQLLDVAPRIVQNRTIVPYRFVGESLGAHVGWDDTNRVAWLWSSLVPYQVQSGDSLWFLAQQLGLSTDQLRQTNGLHSNTLTAGQILYLPEVVAQALPFATVNGYAVITSWGDKSSEESIRKNGDMLTDIASVSHRLRADGSISGSVQEATIGAAWAQGVRPWLVVQNLDQSGSFSRTIADAFLRSATARKRFADQVIPILYAGGFVGLEVDIEDISPANRPYFTLLMKELKTRLANNGFLLGVAVPAKTADSPKDNWSGAYDYAAIGAYVDRVTLMTYDEHWFGGPNGPIASLPWVERVLRYSTSVISAHKLLLGIAAYAYDWPTNGGDADILSAREAARIAGSLGTHWDHGAASPFVSYYDRSGSARILWYEDERSLAAKFDLARSFRLQGISVWRLGLEDGSLWTSLND